MALSTTKVFEKIENYAGKIGLIFAPLFFSIIGAQVDLRAVDLNIIMLSAVVIAIAVVTKLFGCGLPAIFFLKDRKQGMRVGIGMISRGEVGLIVAGVGITAGILSFRGILDNCNHGSSYNHNYTDMAKDGIPKGEKEWQ